LCKGQSHEAAIKAVYDWLEEMMRMNQALFVGGATLVAAAGFALSQDKAPPQTTPPKLTSPRETQPLAPAKVTKATPDYPVICYLEQRERTITVKAGPKGPVYCVKTASGKVLYDNVSLEKLSAQAPALGEFLKTSMAGTLGAKADARLRIKIDASMR
jgi:hypothetical protein